MDILIGQSAAAQNATTPESKLTIPNLFLMDEIDVIKSCTKTSTGNRVLHLRIPKHLVIALPIYSLFIFECSNYLL
jgi:hypothetical protein